MSPYYNIITSYLWCPSDLTHPTHCHQNHFPKTQTVKALLKSGAMGAGAGQGFSVKAMAGAEGSGQSEGLLQPTEQSQGKDEWLWWER